MNSKDEMLLETWPKKQAKGKAFYMAYYAVIYAIIVGVISLLFRVGDAQVMDVIVSKEFLVKLIIFTAIGLVIAHFKWKANNRRYEELRRQNEPEL